MAYADLTDDEKKELWDDVADWFAIPEEERQPRTQKEMYEKLEIAERTWFTRTASEKFLKSVTRKALSKAKKRLPEVLKAMQLKAELGSEKSIEMFLKYVSGLAEKQEIDHTTKGKSFNELKEMTTDELERIATASQEGISE